MTYSPFESLEPRRLFAAAAPDALDQYMVELINRARANPTAEAQRYQIDLQEGLTNVTIPTTPKQPLAFSPQLLASAKAQADWDFHNTTLQTFSHLGPGGNMPDDRAIAAGYALPTGYYTRENAAINLYNALGPLPTHVELQHHAYFSDTANADGGRGHRLQMMDNNLKEVGVGIQTGAYNYTDPNTQLTRSYQGFCTIIEMGSHNPVPYLTGVAYNDTVTADNFYTPGEGLAGVNIAAVRASDGKTFTTTTFSTGGYTLPLSPGSYRVYGFGDALGGFVSYGSVNVSTENVKRDFTPPQVSSANEPFTLQYHHTLFINGSAGADVIHIARTGDTYTVTRSGSSPQSPATFDATKITSIQVDLGAGSDTFSAGPGVAQALYVNGGIGDDAITGGAGDDTLSGAGGKDKIDGGAGDDRLNGGTGRDKLNGDDGNDRLYGGDDNDTLAGLAGVDRLFGEDGDDDLIGGSSNDKLYGGAGNDSLQGDNQNDLLNGGTGNDTLMGGDGDDAITGGAGTDLLFGNKGNDLFDSVDSQIDTLDGGAGVNSGKTDTGDIRTAIL